VLALHPDPEIERDLAAVAGGDDALRVKVDALGLVPDALVVQLDGGRPRLGPLRRFRPFESRGSSWSWQG
jgi:hypothetical protein